MNAADVVGYASPDGYAVCVECVVNHAGRVEPEQLGFVPMFAGDDDDLETVCDDCGDTLAESFKSPGRPPRADGVHRPSARRRR